MTNPTSYWHAEHANFTHLLDLLEQQVIAFRTDAHPDYELMLDVCDYLEHYPDRFHHPREDAAFALLVSKDASLKEQVGRLTHEHRIIAWVGKQLKSLLSACVDGSMVGRAEVEACASMYLVYYRQHLAEEERVIIPAADRLLNAADWAQVAIIVPVGRDPLFGDESLERFRGLRRLIALRAEAVSAA